MPDRARGPRQRRLRFSCRLGVAVVKCLRITPPPFPGHRDGQESWFACRSPRRASHPKASTMRFHHPPSMIVVQGGEAHPSRPCVYQKRLIVGPLLSPFPAPAEWLPIGDRSREDRGRLVPIVPRSYKEACAAQCDPALALEHPFDLQKSASISPNAHALWLPTMPAAWVRLALPAPVFACWTRQLCRLR